MTQIFHASTNTISKVSIFGAVFAAGFGLLLLAQINRSSYVTLEDVAREQPVPFSHAHHVGSIGMDCRYCHTSVEDHAFAGIPPTKTCMNCHSQLYSDSPTLEPVRRSFREDVSIRWTRVHDLADYAYFDHSIHVQKGVACVTCHGPVDRMDLVWKENSLQMEWCLDCHRNPGRYIQPKETVFMTDWEPEGSREELSAALVEEYHVDPQVTCSVCHR